MAAEASTTRTGSDDEQEMERNWEELSDQMERFRRMFGWSTLSERVGRYLPSGGSDEVDYAGFNLTADNVNGIAIIVTSDYHRSRQHNLSGTTSDGERMEEVLKFLNIQVILLPNERARKQHVRGVLQQLSDYLNGIPKDANIANKVLIFAFAGHGDYYNHYDVKLTADDDKDLSLWKEIMPPFVKGHPAHMFKIPKLFFIDACRGGQRLPVADANQNTARTKQETRVDVGNFLIAYSTIKGYVSRDDDTWMKKLADKISAGGHITIILGDLAHDIQPDPQDNPDPQDTTMQPEYISRLHGSYQFPPALQPGPAAPLAALQLDEDPFTADGQLPGDEEEANTP